MAGNTKVRRMEVFFWPHMSGTLLCQLVFGLKFLVIYSRFVPLFFWRTCDGSVCSLVQHDCVVMFCIDLRSSHDCFSAFSKSQQNQFVFFKVLLWWSGVGSRSLGCHVSLQQKTGYHCYSLLVFRWAAKHS